MPRAARLSTKSVLEFYRADVSWRRLFDSSDFARSNSARREALRPRPPRLKKKVSIRRPDWGPLWETFVDASTLAIVGARLVNKPGGGCVESVLTLRTHRFVFLRGTCRHDRAFLFASRSGDCLNFTESSL
jgi:hypothetical protein